MLPHHKHGQLCAPASFSSRAQLPLHGVPREVCGFAAGPVGTEGGVVLPALLLVGKAACPTVPPPLKTVASVPRAASPPASSGDLCRACPAWSHEDRCHRACDAGREVPGHPGRALCRLGLARRPVKTPGCGWWGSFASGPALRSFALSVPVAEGLRCARCWGLGAAGRELRARGGGSGCSSRSKGAWRGIGRTARILEVAKILTV